MSLLDSPIASFAKSDLRKAEVTTTANRGPVEIRAGGATGPLLLVPQAAVQAIRDERTAIGEFVRIVVELRRPDPSPVMLGDVGFVASWPPEDRDRFLVGYAEAFDASLRAESLGPLHAFVAVMSAPNRVIDRPDFDGRVTTGAEEAIAARVQSRRP